VGGRDQRVGVIIAQHPTGAGEGVLGELAGRLVVPQFPQGGGEVGRVVWSSVMVFTGSWLDPL
jgi:hypothetical protein